MMIEALHDFVCQELKRLLGREPRVGMLVRDPDDDEFYDQGPADISPVMVNCDNSDEMDEPYFILGPHFVTVAILGEKVAMMGPTGSHHYLSPAYRQQWLGDLNDPTCLDNVVTILESLQKA